MQITVKEAFEKKVKEPGLRLFYRGNLVYQLKHPYPGADKFIVQFDQRGLSPVSLHTEDLIEVEEKSSSAPDHNPNASGMDNLFNTISRTTDELGRMYEETNRLKAKYKRLEEALQLIADGKADQWIDSRSKYTRWIGFPGGAEIIRQVATLVLRDIDEPDVTDFWMKPPKESEV